MAIDKAVDSARLDGAIGATAEKIREKTGASAKIAWDEEKGFADAVGAIQAGVGGYTYEDFAKRANVSGDVVLQGASLDLYAFANSSITSVVGNNVTTTKNNGFNECKQLKSASFPLVRGASGAIDSFFSGCSALENVNMPQLETAGANMFANCAAMKAVVLPKIHTMYATVFLGCSNLEVIDLGNPEITTNSNVFYRFGMLTNCESLKAVVLRHNAICSMNAASGLGTNNPFAGINGVYSGHIYVPSALIETYRQASNWSTYYANYPEIFQPIEGSEYE